jgi:hypothetical protein
VNAEGFSINSSLRLPLNKRSSDSLHSAAVGREDSFEGWPVGPDEEELEESADEAGSDSCASGQGQVKQQNVDQDGAKDDECDRDVAADEQ